MYVKLRERLQYTCQTRRLISPVLKLAVPIRSSNANIGLRRIRMGT